MTPALDGVAHALRQAWGLDTCAPEDVGAWHPGNPARGQCGVTALVVHDHVGGELVRGEVHVAGERVDFHWWNRLPDGTDVDLTREQFGAHETVVGAVTVARPVEPGRLHDEYTRLRDRVDALLDGDATVVRRY